MHKKHIFIGGIIPLSGVLMMSLARAEANSLLLDFTAPATMEMVSKGDAQVSAASSPAQPGITKLRLDYTGGANPAVFFKPAAAWNWTGAPGLSFTVENAGEIPATLLINLRNGSAEDKGTRVCSAVAAVSANSKQTFTIDFQKRFSQPGNVGGRIPEVGPTLCSRGDKFDFGAVSSLSFALDPYAPKTTLYLSDVRLLPQGTHIDPALAVNGIVDKYGQFAWSDWPGKVHRDEDFVTQRKSEEADLAANPQMPGRCHYGGWADGPKFPATGFFSTIRHEGKWAFVDPDGHLFLSMGFNCVSPVQNSPLDSRKSLYAWLPEATDPMAFARTTRTEANGTISDVFIDNQRANLYRKYGAGWDEAWRTTTERRLPSWGFNTIANWSAARFQGNSKIPYVATIHIPKKYAYLGSMMDPWDPQFAASATEVIQPAAIKVKDDPFCLGYFVDNEMPWAYDYDIAIAALKLDAAKSHGKAAFVEQLKAKYTTIEALNNVWGAQLASWDALAAGYELPKGNAGKLKDDLAAFCKAHAIRYFTVVRDTIKVTDPNHLYLGCRFSHSTGEAYSAALEICDVVSFNIYQPGINEGSWRWLSDKKPTIVGEFHFGALDRGMFRVGMQGAASQEGRGKLFERYISDMTRNPKFIGCHWFNYSDQPLLGRPGDGENFNIGFLSVTDRPYPEMVDAARRSLRGIYEKRWGAAKK